MDDALCRGLRRPRRQSDLAMDERIVDGESGPRLIRSASVGPSTSSRTSAGAVAVVFDSVDSRDVRVVERRQDLRFAFESRKALGIGGECARQDLDGDVSPEAGIVGPIYFPHSAGPERRNHVVVAQATATRQSGRGVAVGLRQAGRLLPSAINNSGARSQRSEIAGSIRREQSFDIPPQSVVLGDHGCRNATRSEGGRSTVASKSAFTCCQRAAVTTRPLSRARAPARPWRSATRASPLRATPPGSARLPRW